MDEPDDNLIASIIVFEAYDLPEAVLSEGVALKVNSPVIYIGPSNEVIKRGERLITLSIRSKSALVGWEDDARKHYAVVPTRWLAPAPHTRDRKTLWL